MRGAADGLSIVVPHGEAAYYQARGSIAVARPGEADGALPLTNLFGLHPALAPLLPLWQSGQMGFVQASGSHDPTRSHFDAQDYMESATPGLKFAPVTLAPFFHGLAEEYRRRPAGADHEITVTVPAEMGPLEADSEKLTQVFGNLIENALKYTPKGSRVEIGALGIVEGEIECYVRDNGTGIPAEDLPHIFERFFRVEKGRSRETGGTGLGLSIVKHIVQLHGGRVWAENREGAGLAILIRLPRVQKT